MKFDESKIINPLHTDRAVVGKRYYAANALLTLKNVVEKDKTVITLLDVNEGHAFPFHGEEYNVAFQYLYLYEEQEKEKEKKDEV